MTGNALSISECSTEIALEHGERLPVTYRVWRNHPRPGVNFPDTAPMTTDPEIAHVLVDELARRLPADIEVLAGIDMGGFGFTAAIAYRQRLGFLDIRKVGSIRTNVIGNLMANYELGNGVVVSKGSQLAGRRFAVIDDCLMSGSTALATVELLRRLGAQCSTALFVFALEGMGGRERLERQGVSVQILKELPATDQAPVSKS